MSGKTGMPDILPGTERSGRNVPVIREAVTGLLFNIFQIILVA
jgi:hypothetical protein